MHPARHLRHRRSAERGVVLLETLVGILIFAFGIVGLVGLQVAMTRAQGSAKYRADAVYLGSELVGRMWADQKNIASYTDASCGSYQPCTNWKNKVAATLPAGTAALNYTAATGEVRVTLSWSTSAEGTHSHVLTTSIH